MPAPASAQSGETVQIEGQATMLATAAPSFNTPTNKIIWEIDLDIKLLDGFD